jgi:hypothetical protein
MREVPLYRGGEREIQSGPRRGVFLMSEVPTPVPGGGEGYLLSDRRGVRNDFPEAVAQCLLPSRERRRDLY